MAETFQPHVLREYALLADGERGAIVGPQGDCAWMCFPRWESGALFAGLLGGPGVYAVTPRDRFVWGGAYEPGSLIWCARWVTDTGALVDCREALALPASADGAVLLRQLRVREGTARMRVVLAPRPGFGADGPHGLARDDGGCWRATLAGEPMRWRGGADAHAHELDDEAALVLDLDLPAGARHDLVLELGAAATGRDGDAPPPDRLWAATEAGWQARVAAPLGDTIAERDARHACAVMSGLTAATGGMVAAATTALPERADRGRDYDYRYVWIRDQCYAGRAAARAGADALLDDAVRFVTARLLTDGPRLQPAYTTAGTAISDQRRVGLPGYPGGGDVVGNRVRHQFQLDVFGEALLLLADAAGRDRLDGDGRRAAALAAEAIAARREESDAGVWELDVDRWSHSRLICAAGLRACAPHASDHRAGERWRALADAIVAAADAESRHPSGRWQRAPGDERVDAALLTAALRGGVAPGDLRSLATLAAVERELTDDGYCYRYPIPGRPLGEVEGAFLLCGFWLALAWEQQGDHLRAVRWFERNRAACGPPGLLSEEWDVAQRQMRGNLPQAFVHALLLECAATLEGG
jgi:alpha,alpha-trehalase